MEGASKNCRPGRFTGPWSESGGDDFIDWEENGPSPGDVMVFSNKEITTLGGKKGVLEGECMVLKDPDPKKPFCMMTFTFPGVVDDRITTMGVLDAMVITGGTGCFYGANGLVMGSFSSPQDLQYNISLDSNNNTSDSSCVSDIFDGVWTEPFGDFFVDYGKNRLTSGDGFVFDMNVVSIPVSTGVLNGYSSGRCFALPGLVRTYCQASISLPGGSVAIGGFFDEMVIMGGTGCYSGVQGTVKGSCTVTGFRYRFSIF